MYFGVDYYPEQWPEERWAEDARLMQEAGFNVARLAEFSWALLEPEEGRYNFDWLDRAIGILAERGIKIVLGTPTAAPPPWLIISYPDVLPVDEHRRVKGPGTRHHRCANSPAYQEHTRRIVTAMAERYGRHPNVIGWQIDNELGCHDTARCYCERCATAFRRWLRERYEDLEALNEAWGTAFWSQVYYSWEQIHLPWAAPAQHNPGLLLDFYRFSSDSWVSYQQMQIDILRRLAPGQFITHNLMPPALFDLLDYHKLAAPLDFASWDNYHFYGATPAIIASSHDLVWGLRQSNFWVMEQQAGQINWSVYNPALRPGEVRLKTYQDIAHGADGVVYFRWRAALSGSEQYHSGLLDHAARPTRGYREAQSIGEELKRLAPFLEGTAPRPQAAILYDYESRWVLEMQPHNRELTGLASLRAYFLNVYDAFYRRNVPVAFVHPLADLNAYRLVWAPALNVVSEEVASHLAAYVKGGGTLVLGPRAGFKDGCNRVVAQPLPGLLAEMAGATVEEFDSPPPEVVNSVRFGDGPEIPVSLWKEVLAPEKAQVWAEYTQDYCAGRAAVTVNRCGKGQVIYLGTLGEAALYDALLERLLPQAGLAPLLNTPPGVEAVARESLGLKRRVIFLLNHTPKEQKVALNGAYQNLLDERKLQGTVTIPARDVLVLGEG